MSQAQGQPDFDLDEDLFDFAGVKREPEPSGSEEDLEQIFASFRDAEAEQELLAVPKATARPLAPAEPAAPAAAAPAPERAPRPEPPAPVAPAPRASQSASEAESALELVPPARPSRLSKGVIAIAAAVTVLNSGLAVVMLRGRPSNHDVRADETALAEHGVSPERDGTPEPGAQAAAPRASDSALPEPESVGSSYSHPTLDAARAEIGRGEYAAARQHVYGLLAIIDRLEDPRRSALEADCQFLIAQSLHLEALARMGASE